MRAARLLILPTATASSLRAAWVMLLSRSAVERKRAAASSMRDNTTVRALWSVGELATSEKASSMSLTAAPRPLAPPWNRSSSCFRRSRRLASEAAMEPLRVAWRVRNWSYLRSTVAASTPLP